MAAVEGMPTFLPTRSAGLRTGFLASEKKVNGCFCAPTAKHLIGRPCDTASITDGLEETWPTS